MYSFFNYKTNFKNIIKSFDITLSLFLCVRRWSWVFFFFSIYI